MMKFSSTHKYFRDKCAWLSEGNFYSDHELFKKSVLGYIEEYKKFCLSPCIFRDNCAWVYGWTLKILLRNFYSDRHVFQISVLG